MLHEFSRTELLIGKDALNKLKNSKVAIFGVGGVGSFTAEGLARAGVGKFILVDDDLICLRILTVKSMPQEKRWVNRRSK